MVNDDCFFFLFFAFMNVVTKLCLRVTGLKRGRASIFKLLATDNFS